MTSVAADGYENDYWSALKMLRQTIRRLSRRLRCFINAVYRVDKELYLFLRKLLLGRRNAPSIEDLLYPPKRPYHNLRSLRKVSNGRVLELNEFYPKSLKCLDVVGLSWITRLCNIA